MKLIGDATDIRFVGLFDQCNDLLLRGGGRRHFQSSSSLFIPQVDVLRAENTKLAEEWCILTSKAKSG